MTTVAQTHTVAITLGESLPDGVAVGVSLSVLVEVACAHGCDLDGCPIVLLAPDGMQSVSRISRAAGRTNGAGPFDLHMPADVGTKVWRLSLAGSARAAAPQHQGALEIPVVVIAHTTSLAVWSIPDSASIGERFKVTVGAKSSAGHDLGGHAIEVCDAGGNVAGRGVLGPDPWQDTSGLYWAEVEFAAPSEAGISAWSARFGTEGIGLPHTASATAFTVPIVPPAQCCLVVEIVNKVTSTPIVDAIVRAGAFRGTSDAMGRAELKVAKGAYEIVVWKTGFDAPDVEIEITQDVQCRIEAVPVPEEDPDGHWLG